MEKPFSLLEQTKTLLLQEKLSRLAPLWKGQAGQRNHLDAIPGHAPGTGGGRGAGPVGLPGPGGLLAAGRRLLPGPPAGHGAGPPGRVLGQRSVGPQLVEKASQSSRPQARKKFDLFSAATCAWLKTLLRLQVWVLSACSEQNLHAADCNQLEKVAMPLFRPSRYSSSLCRSFSTARRSMRDTWTWLTPSTLAARSWVIPR